MVASLPVHNRATLYSYFIANIELFWKFLSHLYAYILQLAHFSYWFVYRAVK